MRFHLPALPGQPITKANSTCAFTAKVRRFADMMVPRGHEVNIYGDPQHESLGDHVACYEPGEPPAFTADAWATANAAAVNAIKERAEPGDILGLIGGNCQQPLVGALPELFGVEFGIGYGGSFADFRVFESVAWQHTTYGQQRGTNSADGSFYHAVIPGYFDPAEHPRVKGKGDYLLYVGRLEERKGIVVAEQTAERLGMELIIAGAGPYKPNYGQLVGKVGPEERAKLMSQAVAVMMPTLYIEPFGFVAVEAQLSGTPAITTDWGAFPETVIHGETGFRCHTLGEFCEAVRRAPKLDSNAIRRSAVERYSYNAVAPQYENYFERLLTLNDDGWYSETADTLLGGRI